MTDFTLHDWQKRLLDERLAEAKRNPDVWVSSEEVEQEISSALEARGASERRKNVARGQSEAATPGKRSNDLPAPEGRQKA